MQIDLTGHRALVFGASQGIGAATALAFAKAGAQVTVVARTGDKLKSLVKDLPGTGHDLLAVDMSDLGALKAQIQGAIKNGPYTIVVNNSGGPSGGSLASATDEQFLKAFEQHVLSAQAVMNLVLPGMKEKKYGRVINVISTSVKAVIPNLGVSNTIRGAMANWSKTLANEVGVFGVTVNNVLPGYTLTPRFESLRKATAEKLQVTEAQIENQWKTQIPLARFAEPSEVANAILFLASSQAAYISGVNLPVDGGRTPSL